MTAEIDLIRNMNPSQRQLDRPVSYWPAWAKRDLEILLEYRQRILGASS